MKILLTLTLFLIFYACINARERISLNQWDAGMSVGVKNEEPSKGISFMVSRNLPFQWPVIGFKVRFEAGLFTERIPEKMLNEKDLQLSLATTIFLKNIQPYISIGPGYAFESAAIKNKPDKLTTNSFFVNGTAGLQVAVTHPIYPFIELRLIKYFETLNNGQSNSRNSQLIGAIGVRLEI